MTLDVSVLSDEPPKSKPPASFELFWAGNLEYYQGISEIDRKKLAAGTEPYTQNLGASSPDSLKNPAIFFAQHYARYQETGREDYQRLLDIHARVEQREKNEQKKTKKAAPSAPTAFASDDPVPF